MLSQEQYDKFIEELGNENLGLGRKTIIIDEMRKNHATTEKEIEKLVQSNEKYNQENKELADTNVRLFKEVGIEVYGAKRETVKEKTFSESISLEAIEKATR